MPFPIQFPILWYNGSDKFGRLAEDPYNWLEGVGLVNVNMYTNKCILVKESSRTFSCVFPYSELVPSP